MHLLLGMRLMVLQTCQFLIWLQLTTLLPSSFLATITLAPRVGSVLGGTAVLVSGPCLQEDDNIACIFDGEEVEGSYLSEMLAVCITPPFSSIGRVTFQLIVEGSDGIVQGTETFLSGKHIFTVPGTESIPLTPSNILYH